MRIYNQIPPALRFWLVVPATVILVAGVYGLISIAIADIRVAALVVAVVLALLVLLFVFVRILPVAMPRKREQEIARLLESLVECFVLKVGDQKRRFYFTAKKRFEAAAGAIETAEPKSMILYLAELKRAEAMVRAGQYDTSVSIFESLARLATENRDPAFDVLEMYSAVQKYRKQRAARKLKARKRRQ
jgi:hypothetical protein